MKRVAWVMIAGTAVAVLTGAAPSTNYRLHCVRDGDLGRYSAYRACDDAARAHKRAYPGHGVGCLPIS